MALTMAGPVESTCAQATTFIRSRSGETVWTPGFGEGAAVQAVCDAMAASAGSGRWVAVNEVTGGGNL